MPEDVKALSAGIMSALRLDNLDLSGVEELNSNEEAGWQVSECSDPSPEHSSPLTGNNSKMLSWQTRSKSCFSFFFVFGAGLEGGLLQQMAEGETRQIRSRVCVAAKARFSAEIMVIWER